ncbi:hypothetical protein LY12_004034 [Prauserella alba]|uniref:AAA+ ATPase domain-containing protein n=1 Tax=Prauserella alba TaxID=176898 RepID=A0ABP4G728_9PSEU|nr:hypothetical protein [Prauserella alba]
MQLIADRVGIDGPHGPLVPQTSLTVSTGELVIVKGEPGTGISAFGLALAGRLRPSTGTVTVHDDAGEPASERETPADGDNSNNDDNSDAGDEDLGGEQTAGDLARDDAADETGGDGVSDTDATPGGPADGTSEGRADADGDADRPAGPSEDTPITTPGAVAARVAVVDAPGVSEPDDALPLRVVVGEELALAGKPASKAAVGRWLTDHDAAPYADSRFEHLDAGLRTRLLTTLAASRHGVRMLVLDRPDRHTSETGHWLRLAREQAERGLAVVVLTATAADSVLPADTVRIGRVGRPDPARPLPEDHS